MSWHFPINLTSGISPKNVNICLQTSRLCRNGSSDPSTNSKMPGRYRGQTQKLHRFEAMDWIYRGWIRS